MIRPDPKEGSNAYIVVSSFLCNGFENSALTRSLSIFSKNWYMEKKIYLILRIESIFEVKRLDPAVTLVKY